MNGRFDLQGHRGARGLQPENTLASFEVALDLGVSSVETDLHLTRDWEIVVFHDAAVTPRLCRVVREGAAPDPALRPLISSLTMAQLRGYAADRNPDPARFPGQKPAVTPLAHWFGEHHGIDPYTPPTLAELLAFVRAYAGEPGERAGKTPAQRDRARQVRLDLELKRVPFHAEWIGDAFDGRTPGLLERKLAQCVRAAGMEHRTTVRSFEHRCVRAMLELEPVLTGAVLVAGTAPITPAELARRAGAWIYCPEVDFLDEAQVKELHVAGIAVLPWTANDPAEWQRLLDWGVDGITTDFPDRLAELLRARGVVF